VIKQSALCRCRLRNAVSFPNQARSYEDWERLHNLDVKKMTDVELDAEQARVLLILATADDPLRVIAVLSDGVAMTALRWLRTRLAAIKSELRRR